jgi:inorganic pyrophosphatase
VMEDDKGQDEKIIAVPYHDPRFEEVNEITDLRKHTIREVQHFFEVYKELEGKPTAMLGWHGSARAREIIAAAHQRFLQRYGR